MQVWTPVQYARAVVTSDFHNVDTLSMAMYVHDELNKQGLVSTNDLQQLAAKVPAIRTQASLMY